MKLPVFLSNFREVKEDEDRAQSPVTRTCQSCLHFHPSEEVEGAPVLVNVWSIGISDREGMKSFRFPFPSSLTYVCLLLASSCSSFSLAITISK